MSTYFQLWFSVLIKTKSRMRVSSYVSIKSKLDYKKKYKFSSMDNKRIVEWRSKWCLWITQCLWVTYVYDAYMKFKSSNIKHIETKLMWSHEKQ